METINDRMEMLVNELFAGNKAAFAKAIAVEPATMSSYLGNKRRSKPSVDMVAKIILALNVDAKWLLTGIQPNQGDNDNDSNADNGGVAIAGNATAHHFTTNASTDTAALNEQIKLLKDIIKEKERLITFLLDKQ